MKKYGLTGDAGAGKDTAGVILAKMVGKECEAIATPMKSLVHTLFKVHADQFNDRITKEAVMSWYITYESLQACADVYEELGLNAIQPFPDAWDQWVGLLDVEIGDRFWVVRRSMRQIYQAIGTGWGRTTDADIWINLFPIGKIATDVREVNEAERLIDEGYDILKILNDRATPVSSHSSENGLPDHLVQEYIHNHGTMNELYKVLKDVVDNDLR